MAKKYNKIKLKEVEIKGELWTIASLREQYRHFDEWIEKLINAYIS